MNFNQKGVDFVLLFKTNLGQSSIHGVGLFAGEFIPKGSFVWVYNESTTLTITPSKWNEMKKGLPETAFASIERFAYFRHGVWLLNLDDSRFMNHLKEPNLGYDQIKEVSYASRDINLGEELTCNYDDFCQEEHS